MIRKTIGKNTIGDGKKMTVNLKTYNRSTHDLSYVWRSTMAPGLLVPFMSEVALPGDIHEIDIEAKVLTQPTVGPLFGSFKLQGEIYTVPFRLYNSALHNNMLNIGLNMSDIKLPKGVFDLASTRDTPNIDGDSRQINPSSIFSYMGLKGFGGFATASTNVSVKKQIVPILGYLDIFKNYHANKQEENFKYIGPSNQPLYVLYKGKTYPSRNTAFEIDTKTTAGKQMSVQYDNTDVIIRLKSPSGQIAIVDGNDFGTLKVTANLLTITGINDIFNGYIFTDIYTESLVEIIETPLSYIDDLREKILAAGAKEEFTIDRSDNGYFGKILGYTTNGLNAKGSQIGLICKTYNSDLFNNWINEEWITEINELTSVDTTNGSFTIDALNMAQKVYQLLNRIAVSDGTYRSWIETVYTNEFVQRCETPVFEGGFSQEVVFQEVISNAATQEQPLGSLGGRGVLRNNRKGGKIKIRTDEPCYIIGIMSLTPRLDYSQGNQWDTNLDTIDDLHKPQLDGIGFQDLPEEWMAWWSNRIETNGNITRKYIGKQPAWIQYMTNYNRTYGYFASKESLEFMVLNRNYTPESDGKGGFKIQDATTYIDPTKYNYIFSDTDLTAQNFWVQLGVDMKVRRKMSAAIMPNL